ncbi:hypothetical protein D3C81_2185100 [compost metagenome]
MLFDKLEQEFLFTTAMVIQRARSEPEMGCQLTQADLAKPLGGEKLQGLRAILFEAGRLSGKLSLSNWSALAR